MFGLGFSEILVIMLVALVAMGPKKLPGVAKALGRGLAEFRNAMDEMRTTVYREVQQPLQKALKDDGPELKETSADYLNRLLAEREKTASETAQKADAIYAASVEQNAGELPVASRAGESIKEVMAAGEVAATADRAPDSGGSEPKIGETPVEAEKAKVGSGDGTEGKA